MTKQVDVAIIGGGTGGYVAAIAAAQAGHHVVVIEKQQLGGTCLHRGCIPSKALLRSAEVYALAKESAQFGVHTEGVKLQFDEVQARKQGIVEQLHRGVQYLMNKHKIEVIHGNGRVMGPSIFSPQSGSVAVELENGESETVVPKYLIIATGSRPRVLHGLEADGQYVFTSDEALEWDTLPQRIAIVGGGVIGIEWASMMVDFGVEVTVIEAGDRILPFEDEDVAREMYKQLTDRGVTIFTKCAIDAEGIRKDEAGMDILATCAEETIHLQVDRMLVSVGRVANVEKLGLEQTNVQVENGVIRVNEHLQTNEPHIYAIGDCIGGLQLAHAASAEGIAAVEHLSGHNNMAPQPRMIPRCVYARPETASIGLTEAEARAAGHDVKVGKIPFQAIGKALVYGETGGFVKVIADQTTNDVLGVHMIGPHATELISEAAVAQLLDGTPWEIGQVIHPHPSLSEAVQEAMLAVQGRSHIL
ncbi:dihydrolipoyl dehydrogenase [Paenibacillus sp. SC116]|uniref:dihydrolipoyl dehydrogenase n=1 Tax=Paenibacillus sp. SC116 TaxID=2968986 RepID=UPI00215B4024|nr:dihydrolipoyl dehydrogenase [Paenibacillus sp. SC116]MCR8843047.1 dihydrolipoyl dehydrogenase [Paenibacillus sp. SC116]